MNHKASPDDEMYLSDLRLCAVDAAKFHHREHLRVAYTLLANDSLENAFERLKDNILGLLNHLGVGTSKYNETMTWAWLLLVHHCMCITPQCECFDEFMRRNPMLLDQGTIHAHYSEALLKSEEAKDRCLPADLEKIPRHD